MFFHFLPEHLLQSKSVVFIIPDVERMTNDLSGPGCDEETVTC